MNKKNILEDRRIFKRNLFIALSSGLIVGAALLFFSWILSIVGFISMLSLFFLSGYLQKSLAKTNRIKKMENVFPDFLQLMSSNLRAGITVDKAILLSSRKEFYPLDEEIMRTGKDITTGKSIESALLDMGKRIESKKIEKTILLIISGIKAGGNLAVLLEETSVNMRERDYVEKRAASNVLMYVIFVFIAVSVGAPALFSLSGILVETLTNILGNIPTVESSVNLPFALSSISIPTSFVRYFSIIFIVIIDILASLVLGLISKGEEKEGIKYFIPILFISLGIFFAIKYLLSGYIGSFFS